MALEDIVINEVIVEEEIQLDYRVGVDGVTFTPQVTEVSNEETILSFTNNGGKPNPEPTNIKGKAFTYDDFTPAQIASLQQPALDAAAIANAATNDVLEAEEVIQANEALRISAEIDRNDAEVLRNDAEETRVTSEILREQSESIRKNAEILRNSSEVSRNNAELLRDSTEQTRISNEGDRVDAEIIRESNEDSRKENELTRVSSESTRANNEIARQFAENNRTVAESDRVDAEELRESNEIIRQENEVLRVSAENIRLENEGDATKGRIKAENDRVTAEIARNVVSNIYNVTLAVPLTAGQYYTSATARAAVPSGVRKRGLELIYETSAGVWYKERFIGDVANWTTASNWELVPIKSQIETIEEVTAQSLVELKARIDALQKIISEMILGSVQIDNLDIVKKLNLYGSSNMILTGTAAPAVIPDFIGQLYIKTTATKAAWIATNNTAVGDWLQIG